MSIIIHLFDTSLFLYKSSLIPSYIVYIVYLQYVSRSLIILYGTDCVHFYVMILHDPLKQQKQKKTFHHQGNMYHSMKHYSDLSNLQMCLGSLTITAIFSIVSVSVCVYVCVFCICICIYKLLVLMRPCPLMATHVQAQLQISIVL